MGIIDPMAMTSAMAGGGMDFGSAAAVGLTLVGLIVGCGAGILFSRAAIVVRPARARRARPARWAEAAK